MSIKNPLTVILRSVSTPQNAFLLLGTFFGLVFIFVTPPALVGDEPNHFFRAYQLSEGHIMGERRGDLSGGWLPQSVLYTNRKLVGNIEMNQDVKFDTNLFSELLYLPLNPEEKVFERFPNTVVYTPIPYLPQTLGILVGRIFNATPLVLIYLARIVNLFGFLALAYFAIKKTPVHKWVFCLLCLTPTNVFQVSSASADAFTYGICFLTIAYFLFYAFEESELRTVDTVKLFSLCVLAVLCKQAYVLLPLLFLLIPRRKFGSLRNYLFTFSALLLICFGAVAAWSAAVKSIYLPYRIDIPINPEQQAGFILSNPFNFIRLAAENYIEFSGYYFVTFFGQLTWLDLHVPTWLTIFVCLVLMAFSLLDKDSEIRLPSFGKLLFLFILIGTALIVSTLLYMTWSPINGNIIDGIQGRYFIPVAPLFFLLFYNIRLKLKFFERCIPVIVYLTVFIAQLITLNSVVSRYYV